MKHIIAIAVLGVAAVAAQTRTAPATVNWPLHNLDLAGSRYSPLDQIDRSNVKSLVPRWLFQHGVIDGVSNQTTPIVVDGTMYVTDSRGSVYAVDAADGRLLWSYDVTARLGGGAREGYVFRNRGVSYGDGVVYTAGGSFIFALDAKTGRPIPTFGKDGQASVILDVLSQRYDVKSAISMGYWFTTAPQYFNGVLYIGSTRSESHIPGGHVLAVDAKTGKVLWHFNTIPQDEKDQGWDVAGPTWVGGERNGGGIWETAAIDPELGLLFMAVGNPFGDSSKRAGTNLFTSSIIALTLDTGRLKWYFQQTHHDVWDYDSGAPPILFDLQVSGRRVKALAEASKNGFLYILDRETGTPVHPIKEMPVPTDNAGPGEAPWPTQPIPFTESGKPMEPVCPVEPIEIPAEQLARFKTVPVFSPRRPNQIAAPGVSGGTNYSPLSYSPRTGLLYVNAIDQPFNIGRGPKGYFSAYDPTTGELKWRKIFEGFGQAGSVVTAGDVVFVGTGSNIAGYFFAFDAKTGDELWKFNTGAGVFSSPSVYVVNGEQFVAVASGGGERGRRGGDLILSFALPPRSPVAQAFRPADDVDAAFAAFFDARTAADAAAAVDRIVASGVGLDDALRRLKQGRAYSREVARGVVQGSYRSKTGEYFYTLDVPESYDPARKYQVRVQLHGGVGRIETNAPLRSGGRLLGVEQIYVMPSAWRDAPWWTGRQVENLRAILDVVKRTYNVDENRVVLSGVSDGGTGVYYTAMRDTTPFASFLPLNGFIRVLENETGEADGDLFPNNLLNKPLFIVNGGRDPMYPTSVVDPYVEHLKSGGVDLVYRPQPNAGHDTSWWPEVKESFERFAADHPRVPLPDALIWEMGPPNIPSRAHWLVIDRLGAEAPDSQPLPDVNRMSTHPAPDFGIRASGTRINRVAKGSNAEQIGLRSGDVVLTINNQPVVPGADVVDLLRSFPSGRPLLFTLTRGGESVRLSGRYAPAVLPAESDAMFPRQRESGRVDLIRTGNRVEARSRGVAAFTLLLSPDQFDLNHAVTVVVNGRTAFDGTVQSDIRTLLKWAARDNDRTMLFAAELPIAVPQ